jgi:hypothetical protein
LGDDQWHATDHHFYSTAALECLNQEAVRGMEISSKILLEVTDNP